MARGQRLATTTEVDALAEYQAHLRDCPPCRHRGMAACGTGIRLHDHWRQLAARQEIADAQARPQRRRAGATA